MNKKEQALLNKTTAYDYENPKPIKIFYLLNTHKLYKGFWGKNGYNNIIVIGTWYDEKTKEEHYYRFDDCKERDVVNLFVNEHAVINIDIDNEFDTLRVCLDERVYIAKGNLSNFVINTK